MEWVGSAQVFQHQNIRTVWTRAIYPSRILVVRIEIGIISTVPTRWINNVVVGAEIVVITFRNSRGRRTNWDSRSEGRVAACIPEAAPSGHGEKKDEERKEESQ